MVISHIIVITESIDSGNYNIIISIYLFIMNFFNLYIII